MAPAGPLGMAAELSLKIYPPDGGDAVSMTVSKLSTGGMLKQRVQYIARAMPEDQVLRFRNDAEGAEEVVVDDDTTLEVQGVQSGAVITIEQVKAAPCSASQNSISKHGKLSYYHTYREDPRFSAEQSVQKGGEPVRLEASASIESDIRIVKYTWADDAKNVKVFVDAEEEPRAVKAAGDGKGSRVNPDFQEQGFRVAIQDEGRRFVLEVPKLYEKISPKDCKVRVSEGKRITVTLRKQDTEHTWYMLLEASAASRVERGR